MFYSVSIFEIQKIKLPARTTVSCMASTTFSSLWARGTMAREFGDLEMRQCQ